MVAPSPLQMQSELEHMLRHENEQLIQENRMLKDKLNVMTTDMERLVRSKPLADPQAENEVRRLRGDLSDKQREIERLTAQIRETQHDSDKQIARQKSEWADIYSSLKRESEDLKRDIRLLNQENERLLKQLEQQRNFGPANNGASQDKEVVKRLKKRELECQALWETLRDMRDQQRGIFDTRQMMELLSVRALDTKAKRKLGI